MAGIRIIAVPPGEAPQNVREAWVGLELPLLHGRLGESREWGSVGVLTGPKTFIERLRSYLFGKAVKKAGYAVPVNKAIEILAAHNREAAQWWRENTPHLFHGPKFFLFPREVCSEVQTRDR